MNVGVRPKEMDAVARALPEIVGTAIGTFQHEACRGRVPKVNAGFEIGVSPAASHSADIESRRPLNAGFSER